MPGRKTKCPACGESIFVRTRPQDKARILVREDQLLIVEEQWAIANGTHEQFLVERRRHDATTAALRQRFGKEPSKNDVQWAKLNDDTLTYIRDWDWLYRNARFAMSELLVKEAKYADAPRSFCWRCATSISMAPATVAGIATRPSYVNSRRLIPSLGFSPME